MAEQETPQQQFNIHKIYLKDVSFEAPNTPAVFKGEWNPQVNVEMTSNAESLGGDDFETVLNITVTCKQGETTAYLCEVQQAGIFQLSGFPKDMLEAVLGSYCPATLFPYAREAISSLVTQGGFPQMLLGPVNFDALYAQQRQERDGSNPEGGQPAH